MLFAFLAVGETKPLERLVRDPQGRRSSQRAYVGHQPGWPVRARAPPHVQSRPSVGGGTELPRSDSSRSRPSTANTLGTRRTATYAATRPATTLARRVNHASAPGGAEHCRNRIGDDDNQNRRPDRSGVGSRKLAPLTPHDPHAQRGHQEEVDHHRDRRANRDALDPPTMPDEHSDEHEHGVNPLAPRSAVHGPPWPEQPIRSS